MAQPHEGTRNAFFYGTLMAPQVLHRVIHGTTSPSPSQSASLTIAPALLPHYTRHRVANCDYPAITPSSDPAARVRGTYVRGLTAMDQYRLDIFEGDQYDRVNVVLRVLDGEGKEGPAVEAETYVWRDDERGLEAIEWDFDEFRRTKMGRWVGWGDEYEEVDEAVAKEGNDPTGGRGLNGTITEKLEGKGQGGEKVLESAV